MHLESPYITSSYSSNHMATLHGLAIVATLQISSICFQLI